MDLTLSKECLSYNNNQFYLFGMFLIISNYENEHLEASFEYAFMDFDYDIENECFNLDIDIEKLAKMIEFCSIYKNRLTFHFTGHDDYYHEFQCFLKIPDIQTSDIFIFPFKNDYNARKFVNQTNKLFNRINCICNEFVVFVSKYLKENNF